MRVALSILGGALAALVIALHVAGIGGTSTATTGNDLPEQKAIAAPSLPPVEVMVKKLERRLAEHPDDVNGWATLGRSYLSLGQFDPAATAFDRAIALAGDVAFLHAARGEALVMGATGLVTAEAGASFERALELDPRDPRARYYLALRHYQEGRTEDARAAWEGMLASAPPEAPWRAVVRQRIAETAASR